MSDHLDASATVDDGPTDAAYRDSNTDGMRPTIQLRSGAQFNLLLPETSDFTVHDIAHALSNLCRFTGHTSTFYSVAQHSVHVSYLVPAADALAGLLHDAAEAFIGDVSSPLKRLLPEYRVIEERIERVVFRRLGVPFPLPGSVKHADRSILESERACFLPIEPTYAHGERPCNLLYIEPLPPAGARDMFLRRYRELRRSVRYGEPLANDGV